MATSHRIAVLSLEPIVSTRRASPLKAKNEKSGKVRTCFHVVALSIDEYYTERAIKLVKSGRMDAFWSDSTVYSYYLAKNKLTDQTPIKQLGCVHQQNLYIGFSPKRPERAKLVAR